MLDVHRHGLPQAGELPRQRAGRLLPQRAQGRRVARLLLAAPPARAGHRALGVDAVGLGGVGHGAAAERADQRRVRDREGAQLRGSCVMEAKPSQT
ncbi:MAG TPA: hypothetical protein VFW96_15310 [Thermomicrobiales bacterium]|nr:hypothetical protein [Thermomicrobiales bacterium]